jgi:hypothetical protein
MASSPTLQLALRFEERDLSVPLPNLYVETVTQVLSLRNGVSVILRMQVGEIEDMAMIVENIGAILRNRRLATSSPADQMLSDARAAFISPIHR